MYQKLLRSVRVLLGLQLIINGLNWWVKLIDPYPSISDFAGKPPDPHMLEFMRGMIDTHLIFHLVKAVELCGGILLLSNVCVPFALVFGYPVAVIAFLVDVFLTGHLRARIMGTGILFNTSFLLAAYFGHYRSMLSAKAYPDAAGAWGWSESRAGGHFSWMLRSPTRRLLVGAAVIAAVWGCVMVTWLAVMMVQHVISPMSRN